MTTHGFGKARFEQECRRIRPRLMGTGLALMANDADAEDAVQDTLLKLWGVRERIADEKHFANLAVSIMRHTCLNMLRSLAVRRSDALPEELEAAATETPLTLMEKRETARQIREIWYGLPQHQRALLHMKEVERLSTEEIAALLGTTACNVRARLSRARKEMLARIGGKRDF